MGDITFVAKPSRISRKKDVYIIYIPKPVRPLIKPDKKYRVTLKELEREGENGAE